MLPCITLLFFLPSLLFVSPFFNTIMVIIHSQQHHHQQTGHWIIILSPSVYLKHSFYLYVPSLFLSFYQYRATTTFSSLSSSRYYHLFFYYSSILPSSIHSLSFLSPVSFSSPSLFLPLHSSLLHSDYQHQLLLLLTVYWNYTVTLCSILE